MLERQRETYDLTSENCTLGTIINSPDYIDKVKPYISESTLYSDKNKAVWNLLIEMQKSSVPIDLQSICSVITKKHKNSGISASYIVDLTMSAGTEDNVEFYATKVYEKHLLRKLLVQTKQIEDTALAGGSDVYNVLSTAQDVMGELLHCRPNKKFKIEEGIAEAISSIKDSEKNLIRTGYGALDRLSGGMTRGEITVLGGRPGHGKTTMMLNVISKCIHSGHRVMVFNREMTNVEMLKKIIALESGSLSYSMIRQGVYDIETLAEMERTKEEIEKLYCEENFQMFDDIVDFPTASAEIKRFKPDIVFDDYIQLIAPDKNIEQRRLQIEDIIHNYKWVAKTTGCSCFLLSQLNRMVETRNSKPKLSDVAESGAIEQVAENVLFVYYDYKVNYESSKQGKNIIELIASKVRYGTSSTIEMGYNGDKVKIYDNLDEYVENNPF